MKSVFCVALVLASVASTAAVAVTPIQKVVQMLNGMMEKGKVDKHAEAVNYAAFVQFCEDTTVEKKRSIDEADSEIANLKAKIEKYTADAKLLSKEIAEHEEDIHVWTGDEKAGTTVREIEKSDYDTTHVDYSESISALGRAIQVLKKQAHNRPQVAGDALVQVAALKSVSRIPQEAQNAISAFLQENVQDVGAPEAAGFEFQSQGVIDMLIKLEDKFTAELTQLESEERESVQAYKMLMQDMKTQIAAAKDDVTTKSEVKAKKLEAKATAEGNLEDTQAARDADAKYLADLTATCEKKASDFTARQQLRAEEIEAIEKAIEIISSNTVSGHGGKYLPGMLQVSATSLALRSTSETTANQARVAKFLRMKAKQLNSQVLAAVADHAASGDPFVKVKKMIKDLLVRLMQEANEEAEQKGWCDQELSTNEQTRKEKTQKVEEFHAEIDGLEATKAKLAEDIQALAKAVAELIAAMAKATELRHEEKAKNTETIADAQAAQVAVAQALAVLKEFYAKAGEATALLQGAQPTPEIFKEEYKGMQAENGGVVGMLEVIESDFARLEADTKSAETAAQTEYDAFMKDSAADKAAKTKDSEHKTAALQDTEQDLVVAKEELLGNQKELEAALEYFDKLKPSCIDAGVSYEDRVERRKNEIESLQEALSILNGDAIADEA